MLKHFQIYPSFHKQKTTHEAGFFADSFTFIKIVLGISHHPPVGTGIDNSSSVFWFQCLIFDLFFQLAERNDKVGQRSSKKNAM